MLLLVLLSLSMVFASDNVTDVVSIDENIIDDESVALQDNDLIQNDDDSSVLCTPEVVTKDNFTQYFNNEGYLLSNVTADEIKFSGEISNVGVDKIVLNRSINITGENAIFKDISISVVSGNVNITGITINQNNLDSAISISNAEYVKVDGVSINYNAISGSDGYAIIANNAGNLKLINNIITYAGATSGSEMNNIIRVSSCDKTSIINNKINSKLVSAAVDWKEIPTGSGNWVSTTISEGIVIEESNGVLFDKNNINVTFNNVTGDYDSIYSLDFKNSHNAIITDNNITSSGNTYIYGITITGNNFLIKANNISSTGNYYANGIDIEGPASGNVVNNTIVVNSPSSAYAIYSGMNGQNVNANYTGNKISGNSYNYFGMSIGDVKSNIVNNEILIEGNYSTGIAYRGPNLVINNNTISANGSNVGNLSVWEAFGVQNVGVKITQGFANIFNNTIETTGDYAIDIGKTNTTIGNNELKSAKGTGNSTILKVLKTSFDAHDTVITLSVAKAGYIYKIVLKDEDGLVLANTSITINNATFTTDANGVVNYKINASKVEIQTLSLSYAGDNEGKYLPTTANATIKIIKSGTKISAKKNAKFKVKAKSKKLAVTLKDSNGNAISGVKVSIKIKKKTFSAKTNANGKATIKIKYKKKVTAKTKVVFAGNELYEASSQAVKITIKK